jgi:predicted dehydrogenase
MYDIGIVGCGVIGNRLAETIDDHPATTVAAACDLDESRVTDFADEYDCTAYTDHETLVETDLDAVYVGVPPAHHVTVATDALAAGHHVLCEKPIAPTAAGGERLTAAAAETNRVTAVNLPFRYTPGFRELCDRVANGGVGEVRRVELRFRFPEWPREWQDVSWLEGREQGGPIREVGTHFLFGVRELFGPIERVTARVQYDGPERHERSVVGDFAVDRIDGTLDLATGVAASEENSLTVLGTEEKLTLRAWHRLVADDGESSERVLNEDRTSTTRLLLDEFVAAMDDHADEQEGGAETTHTGGESATTHAGSESATTDADEPNLVSFAEATAVQRVVDSVFDSEGEAVDPRVDGG